ncbi:hypothetical protein ACFPRL_24330 [Pseudoclavibacter helvolus]
MRRLERAGQEAPVVAPPRVQERFVWVGRHAAATNSRSLLVTSYGEWVTSTTVASSVRRAKARYRRR